MSDILVPARLNSIISLDSGDKVLSYQITSNRDVVSGARTRVRVPAAAASGMAAGEDVILRAYDMGIIWEFDAETLSLAPKRGVGTPTIARTGIATRVGPDGLVRLVAENLILQSETFDNASWTKGGGTVSANAAIAPDGASTADKFVEDTSNGQHTISQNLAKAASPVAYLFSVYVKAAERTNGRLLVDDAAGNGVVVDFNLAAGTIGATTIIGAGVSTGPSALTFIGNGWYRVSVGLTTNSVATVRSRVMPRDSAGNISYAGDGVSGMFVWGAMLHVDLGMPPSDYIATVAASASAPRFDYDPATSKLKGLLVEESRINICLQSSDLSTTWTNFASSEAVNCSVAPDGSMNADCIIEDTANATHGLQQSITFANATAYSFSVYLKAKGRTWAWLFLPASAFTAASGAYFDLYNGVVGSLIGSGVTATITYAGNGWWRCTVMKTSTAAAAGNTGFGSSTGDAGATYTGDGASGICVWGAQVEAGAFPTSYIPTLAASVTRAADNISVPTASITGISLTALAMYAEAYGSPADNFLFSLDDGTANEVYTLMRDSNRGGFRVRDGGATVAQCNSVANWTDMTLRKLVGSFDANSADQSLDAAAIVTDATVTAPTPTTLRIGCLVGTLSFWNSHIRKLRLYNRKLTNGEVLGIAA